MKLHIRIAFVILFLAAIIPNHVYAQNLQLCHDGDYWVFNVVGKNTTVSRSDEANGTYTINCEQGKPILKNDIGNTEHLMHVIPMVPYLTNEPPWFKFLSGQNKWDWDFQWTPPNTYRHRTEKWVAHFTVTSQNGDLTVVTRNDEQKSQREEGFRKYEYIFSKEIGSVVKMSGEWKNGTTYKMELIEHNK